MFEALALEPWYFRSEQERLHREKSPKLRTIVETDEFDQAEDVRTDVTSSFLVRDFQLRYVKTRWIDLTTQLIQEDALCMSRI